MFPDSEIAQDAAYRTKTTAIVKHALAPALNAKVVDSCRTSCDDQADKKYFGNGQILENDARHSSLLCLSAILPQQSHFLMH